MVRARMRSAVRHRLIAAAAGLLALTLLPQAANAARPVHPASEAAAAAPLSLADLVAREQQAQTTQEQRLLAGGPIDETELNRMLIQDLADYDTDAEVRAAATAVLATNDPVQFSTFLDTALPIYRAAAVQRRKELAAVNLALVQRWAEEGGPIVRTRAAAALATKNDTKIADFVAIGHAAAQAADEQDVINAAEQARLIKARVEQMVASGGYEVNSAGQAALDTDDPVTIAAFYNTGYKEAAARDTTAQNQIQQALAARAKAVADLADLASRATQAANARVQIITSSVAATKSLTIAANSLGLVNRYAKQGDAIYTADIPIRKANGQTHTADLTKLRVDSCAEWATTTRNADQVVAQAGVADTAAQTLIKTGLSNGVTWATVLDAQKEAASAAKQAAETGCHAAEATEAAAKTLDADHNATVQANNAVKYRQAAEREAAAAKKLADAAEKLAAAAQAAEQDAHRQRLRAEQDARDAWAKADEAKTHYERAVTQRNLARQQMVVAVAQQAIALDSAKTAVAQQKIAADKGVIAKAAADEVNAGISRFNNLITGSQDASADAQRAIAHRDTLLLESAAYHQEAVAGAGTAEGAEAARQAAIIDAQLPGARAAADSAKSAAGRAAAAADSAAVAAKAAAAHAEAAAVEARAAATAAAGARKQASDAVAAAGKAIADAQKANEFARQSVNVARAAINAAVAAKADAELTQSAADNALREAGIASFQSRIAGRAAVNARVSALGIADPAATAIDVASAYAETDNDAQMAIDIANSAILIGATNSAAAEAHAADSDAAAIHAAQEALRAQEQVKPAFEAARLAALDAARAIRASKAAIEAAIGAAKEAGATIAAAVDATEAARRATAYANGAERMAIEAGHDAAVARQASANAKYYSGRADLAARNADTIAKQIESAGKSANFFANSMKTTAAEMTRLAQETRGAIPQLSKMIEAEKQARLTSWLTSWKDAVKKGVEEQKVDKFWTDFYTSAANSVIDMVGGTYLAGLCEIGHPTDPSQSDLACDALRAGISEMIKHPGSLIHLEEWQNGEYGKALGMTLVDLATLDLPKIGKIGAGLSTLKDGLTAAVAKLLSGELLTGIKNFTGKAIENALGKLGAINVAKLLEFDLPKKLTFSVDEINALKMVIDVKGIDAVEKSLKGLVDGDTLKALDKLMDEGDGLDWFRACTENSFAAGTPVLLADGSRKPIERINRGDRVLATDPEKDVTQGRPVTALHRNLDTDLADLTVSNGAGRGSVLHTTQRHPFWDDSARQWTYAAQLRPGDRLLTADDSQATVGAVRSFSGFRPMFNLTVAGLHTYYVFAGETPVLVHNCPTSTGGGSGATPPRPIISIWRTPKKVDVDYEKVHGPNPASRMEGGDDSFYFGEKSVAEEYQGRGTYANGMYRYDMDMQDFLKLLDDYNEGLTKILAVYDHSGPNGAVRMQFVINFDFLERFNAMTVNRQWFPKTG
jgi:pretoxin HINT domain-containing protein